MLPDVPVKVTALNVAFPVALTIPPVKTLPPVMLAVTSTELSVPTLVIFGCAAVVTVPAVLAVVADPDEIA